MLAQAWRELFSLERVGRQDNFFELGGHSLLSVKMVAKVFEALGVNLSVVTVFRYPTLSQLAKAVEEQRDAGGSSDLRMPKFEEGSL